MLTPTYIIAQTQFNTARRYGNKPAMIGQITVS